MSDVDTDYHGFVSFNQTQVRFLDDLVDATQLQIELQRHVGNVLVPSSVLPELRAYRTDGVKTIVFVGERLDTLVQSCVYLW